MEGGSEGRGLRWSLPNSLGPLREDKDKAGQPCTVHDFVVHPDTLRMSLSNARFRTMLTETALEGVERARGLKLDHKDYNYPKMAYKGVGGAQKPSALAIRREAGKAEGGMLKPSISPEALTREIREAAGLPAEPPAAARASDRKAEAGAVGRSAFSFDKAKSSSLPTNDKGERVPRHEVVHRGEVDWSEAWGGSGRQITGPSRTPRELVVRIFLPTSTAMAEADLNVSDRALCFHIPGQYW